MDFFLNLLSMFLSESGKEFLPLFESLKENSFDIKKTVSNIKPETVKPILDKLFNNPKKSPPNYDRAYYGLNPIENFADKEIINSLNGFFGT